MSEARVVAVNVVYEIRPGPTRDTAIDKRPVDGPVRVGGLGLAGDTQCDTRHHGGPDRAVYVYAGEDADWWSSQLGREIPPGLFGENLTTEGVDVGSAIIGQRWRVGEPANGAVVEVRMHRVPCGNLSARMDIPDFHRRFYAAARVGAYLKVITTGVVAAGDPVTVVHRPSHGVTIADWCKDRTAEHAQRLLESGIDLADSVRETARKLVGG
jgi:MOSC domain-containing protein YiiM